MPLLPIDLQTMFAHMNQVGREEAVQRQVSPEAQSLQAMNIARRTEERDKSVNEANEVSEGAEKVQEEERRAEERQEKREKKDRRAKAGSESEIFRDPALGRHIDIEG